MASESLLDRIDTELKQAMREKDETTKLALRSLKTALTEEQKSGSAHDLNDDEIMEVVNRAAKQRRDAIREYEKAGRTDLARQEQAELTVLERYLPEQLSEAEVEEIVKQVIAETGAESPQDMGKVMPVAMARTQDKADGRVVSQIARRLLS